jgi:hypothetical protein
MLSIVLYIFVQFIGMTLNYFKWPLKLNTGGLNDPQNIDAGRNTGHSDYCYTCIIFSSLLSIIYSTCSLYMHCLQSKLQILSLPMLRQKYFYRFLSVDCYSYNRFFKIFKFQFCKKKNTLSIWFKLLRMLFVIACLCVLWRKPTDNNFTAHLRKTRKTLTWKDIIKWYRFNKPCFGVNLRKQK